MVMVLPIHERCTNELALSMRVSDPTVAETFNPYRFADHKEPVIALLARVCTVSVETMKIVRAMP